MWVLLKQRIQNEYGYKNIESRIYMELSEQNTENRINVEINKTMKAE